MADLESPRTVGPVATTVTKISGWSGILSGAVSIGAGIVDLVKGNYLEAAVEVGAGLGMAGIGEAFRRTANAASDSRSFVDAVEAERAHNAQAQAAR